MSKYTMFLICIIVPLTMFAGIIDNNSYISTGELIFEVHNGYDHVSIPNYTHLEVPGHPKLPTKYLSFVIPPGSEFDHIEILREESDYLTGTYNIFPSQEPQPISASQPGEFTLPDAAAYSRDGLYPGTIVKYVHEGNLSGYRIVTLALTPLQYNPVTKRLSLTRSVSFRIHYKNGTQVAKSITAKQNELAQTRVQMLVENKNDVDIWSPPLKRGTWDSEYIIVTDASFVGAFAPLKDWKTKKGVPTEIVTTSWIYSNYSGVDNATKVRNFIAEAADSGAVYFLLAGQCDFEHSEEYVPRRDAYFYTSGVGGYNDEDTIPTDLYFSDLDGTWDLNGNGIYGQFTDGVDGYSDVYVGRAPVKNTTQINNFVSKVITYEKSPSLTFTKKILLPVGNLWSGNYGNGINDTIADTIPNDWQKSKIYESLGLMSRYVTRDSLNQGYNFCHMVGHGNEYGEYYNYGTSAYYYYNDVGSQTNDSTEAAIVNGMGCFCGAVDEAGSAASYDCLAERMVNVNKRCASATIMNSRYGWGYTSPQGALGPSGELSVWFYRKLFGTSAYHLGEVLAAAKDQRAGSIGTWVWRWCLFEYNLFGDPEMPLWTDDPDSMAVTHSSTVNTGTNAFTVTVKESGNVTPIQNALVCLMGKTDTDLYGRGYTNSSGIATITITASVPNDTMWVTVTAQNHYPYEGFAIITEAGMPDVPSIISPLDFARLPDTQPILTFYSNDPQNDNIQYRILWDTDPNFASPDSSTTPTYASGSTANFTFPSPLQDSATYWWKVKCTDPAGSGIWTNYTLRRSLTIGTALPSNTCSWFQTTAAQFGFNVLNGTSIQGDSVVLNPSGGQPIVDTILEENFESGVIPSGWTVIDGNGDGIDWHVGTTSAIGSYSPPSYGSHYAYYDDDAAGSGAINYNEALVSPPVHIPSSAESLQIRYGYGFQVYQVGETYEVKGRFFNGSWGGWNTVATYTSSISGTAAINLTAYLPADSVQFQWMYHDESSSSNWGWACACDNIVVTCSSSASSDEGTLTGVAAAYGDLSATYARPHWGYAVWNKASAQDSVGLQVEYYSSTWQLVPDGVLPGNSTGFYTTLAAGSVDLSGLDTLTYNTLRLVGLFYRKFTDSPNDPALLHWEIGNNSGIETVPPEPFSLISPPDSVVFSILRPTFVWESTVDTGSGIKDYRIYIEGVLRYTGNDTTWTADYDLAEGYNDWYVVAYDSANNSRQSNETWTVTIDTTAPSTVSLISPSNNSYMSTGTANFVWYEASDNISGVDHYVLEYALDNSFTQGLVDTIIVDTTFTTVLVDTTYYWRVKAVDRASNEGAYSTSWQFEIDTSSPSASALVSPTGGIWLSDTQVDLEWTTVTEIIGIGDPDESPVAQKTASHRPSIRGNPVNIDAPIRYILQVDTMAAFTSPLVIDTLTATTTTITLSENFYYWRVKAYDLAGNQGSYTLPDSFGVDMTPPPAVNLIAPANNTYLNNSTADFVWHRVTDNLSGTDYYVLQYALDDGFTQGVVETTAVDTTFTTALADTVYCWRVKAIDLANNEGTFSPTWQFEVDTEIPAAPVLNAPVGGIFTSDTLVAYEWGTVTCIKLSSSFNRIRTDKPVQNPDLLRSSVRYVLQVDTLFDFVTPVLVDTLDTTGITIDHTENRYYWRVKAFDLAGNDGLYSEPDSFGVDITVPVIESTSVWNDTSFIGPFEIRTMVTDNLAGIDSVILHYQRDEDPGWVSTTMIQTGSPHWYLDSIPTVASPYDTVRYYVEAVDASQPGNIATDPAGAPSIYHWFIANCTGIEELGVMPQTFALELKGNPVRSKAIFVLALPREAFVSLRIFDCAGRSVDTPINSVISAGVHEIQWQSKVSAGIYFYAIESPWKKRMGKLVILK